jgi:hypothetical protein
MYISAEDLPPDLRQIMLAVEQAARRGRERVWSC